MLIEKAQKKQPFHWNRSNAPVFRRFGCFAYRVGGVLGVAWFVLEYLHNFANAIDFLEQRTFDSGFQRNC